MGFFKKHKIITTLLILLLVLILLLALLVGVFYLYVWNKLSLINYDDGKLPPQEEVVEALPPEVQEQLEEEIQQEIEQEAIHMEMEIAELPSMDAIISEKEIADEKAVFNVLLLGTDERVADFSIDARADSIMLLSVNRENECLRLVSLQRGMGVPILEGEYAGQYDWLTHCFRYGGADLMMKEVQHCFRVEVDRYVRINFSHFEKMVDAVGGVDIWLSEAEAKYMGLEAGVNHLNGTRALQYSRLRYIDSDWSRIERQRNVIEAIVVAAKGLSLWELNEAANEILPLIQTNLTKSEIVELLLFAPNVIGKEIEQMSLPAEETYGGMTGMGGRSLYAVDFEANAKILEEFLYQ